ncbi:myb-like protein X isoform X2 [Oryzias melastigma]|uniref:myb-like protein X isoform X2 n=1 Tax=Oryzias melastigma TaxID=30732 RepID=UPI00168D1C35|nr:myb-like protein X isoform X2 [Oryzias melastigma]
MATPTDKLKSTGRLTEQNTFLKQWKHFGKRSVLFEDGFSTPASPQHLRVMQLQQDLVQLQERERRAKQRNRQLLQQFEQVQSALEEIMACNTTMKAIRMEYERYLEESAPRWQQQFKEKTEAAQKEFLQQSMEKHLKPRLKDAEDPVPKLSGDSFRSQGAQKTVAPQACPTPECRSSQDGYPYPFTQYSWLTHPHSQTMHPFSSSAFPPYPWSSKDPAVWDSSQHGYPWLPGTSLGFHGYNKEPHPELRGSQNGEQNSKRSGGSRSRHLSQELDIKPVRLSSRHSDSSGSSRCPTLSIKAKGKNRGSVELSSSDINSEESSRTPSVVASVAESPLLKDPSSDRSSFRRTQKSEGLTAPSQRSDKEVEERMEKKRSERQNGEKHSEEESGSSSEGSMMEKEGKQRHGEESKSCRGEELEKDEKKIQNEAAGEEEKQGSGSREQRNAKEEIQKNLSSGEEEKWQKSQEQENRDKDEDSSRETTTEEEAGTTAEEEDEDDDEEAGTTAEEEDEEDDEEAGTAAEDEDQDKEQPKEIDDEKTKEDSSSQDEDDEEMESSEKNKEEDSKSDAEVKTDSDDSIISPQNKRNVEKEFPLVHVTPAEENFLQSSTQMQTIPETAAEEEEDDEDAAESSDEDDVENVLAPQDRKQKGASHADLFQVTEDRQKTEHQSDSDEFDHFYD